MTVEELDRLPDDAARAALARCCGAGAWVNGMLAARPFRDRAGLLTAAERVAATLGRDDWLEAFAQHPRIGERPDPSHHAATAAWSSEEQRGTSGAAAATRDRLAEGNRAYEARFGYGFIVCATGRSAEEMLAELERRLDHEPAHELTVAAGEQRAITRIRLEKLLGDT